MHVCICILALLRILRINETVYHIRTNIHTYYSDSPLQSCLRSRYLRILHIYITIYYIHTHIHAYTHMSTRAIQLLFRNFVFLRICTYQHNYVAHKHIHIPTNTIQIPVRNPALLRILRINILLRNCAFLHLQRRHSTQNDMHTESRKLAHVGMVACVCCKGCAASGTPNVVLGRA
jgi:hypothetical protein